MEGTDAKPDDFSRTDLDRVIRRAAELQFEQSSDQGGVAPLRESDLLRIGSEVGIENRFMRQAIGELRAEQLLPDAPLDRGLLSRLVGGAAVRSYRVVPGSVEDVDTKLSEHLKVAETLSSVRSRKGHSLWEPQRGVLADLRRGLHWRGYRYELARVTGMHVTLLPMEEGFVLASMTADLRRPRSESATGGAIGLGLAFAAAGSGLGWWIGFPLLAVPAALAGVFLGIRVARGPFRRIGERIRLVMEGILDRLEAGEPLAQKALSPVDGPRRQLRSRRLRRRGYPGDS